VYICDSLGISKNYHFILLLSYHVSTYNLFINSEITKTTVGIVAYYSWNTCSHNTKHYDTIYYV